MFVNYCQRPQPTSLFFDQPYDFPISNDIISSLANSLTRSRQIGCYKRPSLPRNPVHLPRVTTEEDESNYYLLMEKPKLQQHAYHCSLMMTREQHPFNSYQFKIENDKLMVRSLEDQYSRSFELPDDADKSQDFELHEFSNGLGLVVVIKKIAVPDADADSEDEEMEEDNIVDFADLLARFFGHPVDLDQEQLQANSEAESIERKKAEEEDEDEEEEEQQQKAAELKRLSRQRKCPI
ncbi:unnamed protein product [Ambrosiozyma monospora]|uniref:Unnamed protein product n=1 Tax=Ambrosiozyma monospora TaxID=43982 RepID=A0A9W6Z5N2_AMBMO|nr:unnamed protein product [Ambrosiozyma monospora]